MIDIYKEMFPNSGMNHQILKSHLCERGINWDKEIRGLDGIKGCYINVIRRKMKILMIMMNACLSIRLNIFELKIIKLY